MEDSGTKSRKYKLALMGICLITGFGLLGLKYLAVEAVFGTYIGGILGVLGLYFTGNVVQKKVVAEKNKSDNEGSEE